MSTEYAILGFLSSGPMTGYDLKKLFDASVKRFWPADQSQIYRALGRLVQHGWVEVTVIQQESRPPRRLHRITADGMQELQRWMLAPLEFAPPACPG